VAGPPDERRLAGGHVRAVGVRRDLMPRVRERDVASALASWDATIMARSRALLEGAAALNALLST
jgi:hypothetical protein